MTAKAPSPSAGAAAAIKAAAQAYLDGNKTGLRNRLHAKVHVLGSEQGEDWPDQGAAMLGMDGELNRIWAANVAKQPIVTGALADLAVSLTANQVQVDNKIAWWSCTGGLQLGVSGHSQASWTVVLNLVGKDWEIVHSHFSIHR